MKNLSFLLFLPFLFLSCSNKPQYNDPTPKHDSFNIESEEVNETRTINIWTPEDYEKSDISYPVLYMPDGGIEGEDFPHIANTIAKLVKNKSIPPIILVGIANTDRRRDLTGLSNTEYDKQYAPQTDGAKNYRAFISNELFAEIAKRYRVTGKKGLVGESLAGLFVVETLFITPNLFDFYIAMDPSLWWNNKHLTTTAKDNLARFPNKNIKFWFAGSSPVDISDSTNKLATILTTNAPETLTWKYSNEPNEKHNTIFRATKEKAFIWTLNN
ncbi:alpha/beta hydrolase-fold protein [Xanthomarina sp. F1114]|uniref:alpha/beta hydrolase n=1 Tax=Xanthomarina sp. F1114 TaxID=2996019 RepID=UPI00225DE01B|nr:alpha/beta hydrolase-fold protein [Xanthomarina sp. F1114]MCX7548012.1 alpha/beta hydrolase-fold protein [Xanthomarina sp. F1114]